MDDQENQGIDHRLAQAIGENADAVAIAEAVASLWLEFEAALRPIVGPAAVTALYRRSLNLASATTPGFNRVSTSSAEGSDVDGLREYFAFWRWTKVGAVSTEMGRINPTFLSLFSGRWFFSPTPWSGYPLLSKA
nr:hypothetical protein [Lysobacter enzymogenes]